jgi:hypothetical protein
MVRTMYKLNLSLHDGYQEMGPSTLKYKRSGWRSEDKRYVDR